jgi:mono/diheme cytochrome c family protein
VIVGHGAGGEDRAAGGILDRIDLAAPPIEMMRSRRLLPIVVACGVVLVAVGLNLGWFESSPKRVQLQPDDAALTARGEHVYREHCASCHGARLEGQPDWRARGPDGLLPAPPHDATGHTWHHPDEVLFRLTKNGVGVLIGQPGYKTAMPAYAGILTDDEILAVLSWIKSKWSPELRRRHDEMNARAATAR